MPNHCWSEIRVRGPKEKISELVDLVAGEEDRVFDFEKILPMPAVLHEIVSGGRTCEKHGYENLWRKDNSCLTPEELQALKEAHGATSWYDWSLENWGTKWNAWDTEIESRKPEKVVFKITTAWSPPDPIIEELRSRFPELDFDVLWEEEGGVRGRF